MAIAAFALASTVGAPAAAADEVSGGTCPISVQAPALVSEGGRTTIRAQGLTPCSGEVRLFEVFYPQGRVLAREEFGPEPIGRRTVSAACEGLYSGAVYAEVRIWTGQVARSSTVQFPDCRG
ncbi:hypothetical protein ACTG9Q_15845 [Actinokineospora sp. 24-640]